MRKFILHITVVFFLFGCSDNTSNCLTSSGKEVVKSVNLSDFSKVIIHEGISLELKQGLENSLQIKYGENLIDNISTTIKDEILSIENSTCNVLRNTKPAQILLTAVNLTEIRNASQFSVVSKEVLKFNSISLFSEDFFLPAINVGDFDLNIDTNDLNIISNNVSNFTVKGKTNNLFVGFYAGEGKFNGEFLEAQNVDVFHRGINTIVVNPIQKLTGEIRGVGDLISVNTPPLVSVQEFYTGKLLFK
ncbi:head GIN domain-containing protein [Aureibaculum sp. 2210JD6-5]|uniref:head GIN domain-containing protein n=1 Tax=Aureibaculum sp. 2210JD6-5 TaxID=3103957 RepID=UPI002AAC96CC|nr:head GIN domain-containing protein [Aureibaculum sp. 2210JD6-5]MDY7394593.1 head GIN domain-containing protein [Aureibaculum sp. 2210JD6-5]